jgi:hypothetical protein
MTTLPPILAPSLHNDLFRVGGAPPGLQPQHLVPLDTSQDPHWQAAEDICQHRKEIAQLASEAVCRAFGFAQVPGGVGQDKCTRDLGLILDYLVLALVIKNKSFLEAKILYWFRKVLDHLRFPSHETSIIAAYSIMRGEALARTRPEARPALEPFVNGILDVLSNSRSGNPAS